LRRDFRFFQSTCCSSKIRSELTVHLTLLALLTLTALAVWVLLLLAGLLAAALLLAGLLPRVLILLTRVLVLIRHRGSRFQNTQEHRLTGDRAPSLSQAIQRCAQHPDNSVYDCR